MNNNLGKEILFAGELKSGTPVYIEFAMVAKQKGIVYKDQGSTFILHNDKCHQSNVPLHFNSVDNPNYPY